MSFCHANSSNFDSYPRTSKLASSTNGAYAARSGAPLVIGSVVPRRIGTLRDAGVYIVYRGYGLNGFAPMTGDAVRRRVCCVPVKGLNSSTSK